MVIFELPSNPESASLRAVSLGSCRVRNPLYVLRDRGDLRICDAGLAATHTAAEALQTIRLVKGEIQLPDDFSPFVFETEQTPPVERLAQTLDGGVDVCLLEVSGDKQFTYGDILLQQNFVSRNLVQAHHGALLGWYREICLGRSPDEDLVQVSIGKLREGGFRHDEWMANLLRGLRLRRHDADELGRTLRETVAAISGRWVVIGAITVPGQEGATMQDRRELNETLRSAAAGCGAEFFDPTHLVATYGRETTLDSGGANINEYAESFYPTLGETLVSLARTGRSAARRDPVSAPGASAPANQVVKPSVKLAERLDAELVALYWRRLDSLGLDPSGLYAHYRARLDRHSLIGARERFAFELIDTFLPSYDAYAVMRAGVGELALLLAASGRKTIAYEPNPNRRGAIEAGAGHLEKVGLLAPGLLTTATTLTPEQPLSSAVLGVGLDVAQVRAEASAAPLVDNARAFEALLIDLRLFVRVREAFTDQMRLAETLRAMGFDKRRDYPAEGLFWFRKSHAEGDQVFPARSALADSAAGAAA